MEENYPKITKVTTVVSPAVSLLKIQSATMNKTTAYDGRLLSLP